MRTQPRGDIHLISSTNTRMLPQGLTSYNVAKAGIEALGKCLAKEERANNIRVNVIGPTTTETDMAKGLLQQYGFSSFREVDKYLPFGRITNPEDIGNLCTFLASREASHISGQIIYVDGSQDRKSTQDFFSAAGSVQQRSGI